MGKHVRRTSPGVVLVGDFYMNSAWKKGQEEGRENIPD